MNYKTKCKHCESTTTTKEKLISWICSSCTMQYSLRLKPLDKQCLMCYIIYQKQKKFFDNLKMSRVKIDRLGVGLTEEWVSTEAYKVSRSSIVENVRLNVDGGHWMTI